MTPIARPPLSPFTLESAKQKIRLAEDGWNSRSSEKFMAEVYRESVKG